MLQPMISLIIPIYNSEKFLWRTLESVQNQTWKYFEAICVNDGSPDNSLEIIKQFAAKDTRFKLINKPNGGLPSARNIGLEKANGQYIMFLDGDDYIHPQAMEVALAAIMRANADVCQFGYQEVQVDERIKTEPVSVDCLTTTVNEPAVGYIKNRSVPQILVWNKIYNADLAKSHTFYPIQPGEDDIYSLQTHLQANKFITIEPKLLYYVQNPLSVMHTIDAEKMYKNRYVVNQYFKEVLNKYLEKSTNLQINKAIKQYLQNYERDTFKDMIIKPLRKKTKNAIIAQNFMQYKKDIAQNGISSLKFKQKLIFKLLNKQHYKLARLLTAI